jgi:hypothetical protein
MIKKASVLICLCTLTITQEIFCNPAAAKSVARTSKVTALNPKMQLLPIRINKLLGKAKNDLEKVKNENDKKTLSQLFQKIRTARKPDTYVNLSVTPSINSDALRKDIFDILRNLTTPAAITAAATILCFAIAKQVINTGEISNIINSLSSFGEQVTTIGKWFLFGKVIIFGINTLEVYLPSESKKAK